VLHSHCDGRLGEFFSSGEMLKALFDLVSSLLKPGGFFFGECFDASTLHRLRTLPPSRTAHRPLRRHLRSSRGAETAGADFSVEFAKRDADSLYGQRFQITLGTDRYRGEHLAPLSELSRVAGRAGLTCVAAPDLKELYTSFHVRPAAPHARVTCPHTSLAADHRPA
jgi:hypothetical protein